MGGCPSPTVTLSPRSVCLLAVEPRSGLHYIWLCKSGAVPVHYGPTHCQDLFESSQVAISEFFYYLRVQQRKSFVHCLPHTHSHAYTNTQTHIHERRSPLPFVTYYCPLVAPGTMASLNSPFPPTFHSPIHLTPPLPVFVPLPPSVCLLSALSCSNI